MLFTSTVISIAFSCTANPTCTESMGTGWQYGSKSHVLFAPIVAAILAASSTLPFGILPFSTRAKVGGLAFTTAFAVAVLRVSGLSATSTMPPVLSSLDISCCLTTFTTFWNDASYPCLTRFQNFFFPERDSCLDRIYAVPAGLKSFSSVLCRNCDCHADFAYLQFSCSVCHCKSFYLPSFPCNRCDLGDLGFCHFCICFVIDP